MKIKNIQRYNNKIIELQILKLYYKKKSYNFKTNIKVTECYLNKISQIIYNYHINNKKILFIGFPKNFRQLLKTTKHYLISQNIWVNGTLSNIAKQNFSNTTKFNSNYKLISKLQGKLDLIIIYNLDSKATAIQESYLTRIPVITLSENLEISNKQATYESPEKFSRVNDKITNNNLFFSIIETTLKKALRITKIKKNYARKILLTKMIVKKKSNHFIKNYKNEKYKKKN